MAPAEISDSRFREVFGILEPHIERRYEIPVVISDVPSPFTGDLDGAQIQVDYELTPEEAVFIIAHLFGHTVQWNVNERYREIGTRGILDSPSEEELTELRAYEVEACRYSMQLFHDVGVTDLDQWMSDYSACDLAYLMHFYRTGEKRELRSFMKPGQPLLEPLPIPEFHPTKWVWRFEAESGVVI